MPKLREAVDDFLAQERIAVAGVSRDPKQAANLIFRTLRDSGHSTFAVNPNASEVEGEVCYPDLKSIPGSVNAVMIVTPPGAVKSILDECADLGIARAWMHRSFGVGSVSPEAVEFCRDHGITMIAGGCPMMFRPGADFGHKCMRWMLQLTGGLPKEA